MPLHLARCSLMLSDHYYSSGDVTSKWQDEHHRNYANTHWIEGEDGTRVNVKKQKLDEHCIGVSFNAYLIAKSLPTLRSELPAIGDVRALRKRSTGRFAWQNKAFSLATQLAQSSREQGGFFVDLASTGTGKTLTNARMAFGLASSDNGCRFTVLLGLRTLTLQTGDALRVRTGLSEGDMAVLIGSSAVREIHERFSDTKSKTKQQSDAGSESAEPLFHEHEYIRYDGELESTRVGRWLRGHQEGSKLHSLISAPVVVGTIDHVMPATESARGGRQIAPMLRLLTSDLILDEPDDFDLADQPALCRLVNWAGMLGSRVVLSSATLPPALLEALFDAYRSGRQAFNQATLGKEMPIVCGWVDEFRTDHAQLLDESEFAAHNATFVEQRLSAIASREKPRRIARLAEVTSSDANLAERVAHTVLEEIQELHEQHHQVSPDGSHRVSIGIVRMANIDPLVQVAQAAARSGCDSMDIHLCVYHSRHPMFRRSYIESELDRILDRRHPEDLWRNPTVCTALGRERRDQVFVVLATAVAEVGRDHCYDWGIIEPSSMRSIVQLAGRVLRHRTDVVPRRPNLVLLRRNIRSLGGKSPAFEKPGFESTELPLASHDLADILPVEHYQYPGAASRVQEPSKPDPARLLVDLEHVATRNVLGGDPANRRIYPANLWWKAPIQWCYAHQARTPFRAGQPTDHYALVADSATDAPIFEKFSQGEWIAREADFEHTSVEFSEGVLPWPDLNEQSLFEWFIEQDESRGDNLRSACRRYFGLSLTVPREASPRWSANWWLGVHREWSG